MRVLIVGMVVVATSFASAIVYSVSSTERVRTETEGMLGNGVPSAEQLTGARAQLRSLDAVMDRALLDLMERRPIDRDAIAAARGRVLDAIGAYRALPSYELEPELNRELDAELRGLEAELRHVVAAIEAGDLQAAHERENGGWRQQSDRVDAALRTLVSFNIRHVALHALRIDESRRRNAIVGMTVGSGGLLLALLATIVAARAVRRQLALQRERAAELEMFSARVAHDVMSPLAGVSLGLELAREQIPDERVAALTVRLLGTLKRVNNIVNGLYSFARAGGKPPPGERAAAHEVVRDVCEEARAGAERENIEICCAAPSPCEVACTTGVLMVLLSNLINNAIKFMGESRIRRITVEVALRAEAVRFAVGDTGPGLPAGFEAVAFDPYRRGKSDTPGLGLGLATVKRLVEAHGGRVGIARGDGAGATFWFELPRVRPLPPETGKTMNVKSNATAVALLMSLTSLLGCSSQGPGTSRPDLSAASGADLALLSDATTTTIDLRGIEGGDGGSTPAYWQPAKNATFFWDLQSAPPDNTKNVGVYDIDGWNNSSAEVAALHARGLKVVCYMDAGTFEPGRPDAGNFPASLKGAAVQGWPGELWLDVRPSGADYATLQSIMSTRFAICRSKGFDAVEPDNIDSYTNSPGFPTSPADQLAYNEWIADTVHGLGMAVVQKNDLDQSATLLPWFDALLDEECNKNNECALVSPYVKAGKPVWNAEYSDDGETTAKFCNADVAAGIVGALFSLALDGTVFQPCSNDVGLVN